MLRFILILVTVTVVLMVWGAMRMDSVASVPHPPVEGTLLFDPDGQVSSESRKRIGEIQKRIFAETGGVPLVVAVCASERELLDPNGVGIAPHLFTEKLSCLYEKLAPRGDQVSQITYIRTPSSLGSTTTSRWSGPIPSNIAMKTADAGRSHLNNGDIGGAAIAWLEQMESFASGRYEEKPFNVEDAWRKVTTAHGRIGNLKSIQSRRYGIGTIEIILILFGSLVIYGVIECVRRWRKVRQPVVHHSDTGLTSF